jgi:excisionase family DNA binding protein
LLFRVNGWQKQFSMSGQFRPRPIGNANMQNPIAVTILEAVKVSGMSRTSIYEALKRGNLTAKKCGRRTLISFAELQAYLANLPEYRPGA